MSQAEDVNTISRPFPTRPMPVVQASGNGFVPVIYHPERTTEWLRFERFPRKAEATGTEALMYAGRVLFFRQLRAESKRQKLDALSHPRWIITEAGLGALTEFEADAQAAE